MTVSERAIEARVRRALAREGEVLRKTRPGNTWAKATEAAKARHAVDTKTKPPQKRDSKAKNEASTVGQVAAKAGTSMHKARQAIAE